MRENEELIRRFYTAFQNGDAGTMGECYSDDAVFNDEIFKDLRAPQARAMWTMLLARNKSVRVEYENVVADATTGRAKWQAYYVFSQTGRSVVNRVSADFVFKDGKIVRHTDRFDFYRWARQALGLTGLLLGWTGFLRNKVRAAAMQGLREYMAKA